MTETAREIADGLRKRWEHFVAPTNIRDDFWDAIESALLAAERRGIERAAAYLNECAQEYNRTRDPGMANHCRAKASAILALPIPPTAKE